MKRILFLLSIFVTSLGFSQADCSNAQTVNLQVDGTVTVSSSGVTGTPPSSVCAGYDETALTAGAWYQFTPSQDLDVTISKDLPPTDSDYFSAFSIFSGSCNDLTCESFALWTTDSNDNPVPAETIFTASANTTYYIVFDDAYNALANLGGLGAFDFDVSTDSNPNQPSAVTNPDPADGSTVFLTDTGETDQNGNPLLNLVFNWDLPSSSDPATNYTFDLGVDNTVSAFSTDVNGTSLSLNGLQLDTTYFWRITSENLGGSTQGTVWTFTTEPTLSSEDFVEAVSFKYFINNGQLNITTNQSFDQINIYNLSGQQIIDKALSSNDENISIQSLAKGLYLAKVQIGNQTKTFKFIK